MNEMEEGRKRVLGIMASILVFPPSKDDRRSARQPAESADGVADWIGRAMGRSDHAKDRWSFWRFQ